VKSSCYRPSEISSPIPGSVVRNQITYDGVPLSASRRVATIPLAEAQRRAKNLSGFPTKGDDGLDTSAAAGIDGGGLQLGGGTVVQEVKKRTFSNLFGMGKKK
jgi:hypothetical protein